jgi:hypothetical protein
MHDLLKLFYSFTEAFGNHKKLELNAAHVIVLVSTKATHENFLQINNFFHLNVVDLYWTLGIEKQKLF